MRETPSPASAVAVRRLESGDASIVSTAGTLFETPPDPEAVRSLLASPSDHLLFAFVDDAPAGYARAHELRRVASPDPTFLVTEIRVEPTLRRQGVGHALILALKDLARARGAKTMIVVTDLSHPAPEGLYASTGGVQAPRRNLVYEYDLARGSR